MGSGCGLTITVSGARDHTIRGARAVSFGPATSVWSNFFSARKGRRGACSDGSAFSAGRTSGSFSLRRYQMIRLCCPRIVMS